MKWKDIKAKVDVLSPAQLEQEAIFMEPEVPGKKVTSILECKEDYYDPESYGMEPKSHFISADLVGEKPVAKKGQLFLIAD